MKRKVDLYIPKSKNMKIDCMIYIEPRPVLLLCNELTYHRSELENLCELNGIKTSNHTLFFSTVIHSNDSDDFFRNGLYARYDFDGKIYFIRPVSEYLPVMLFNNKNEGDAVSITLPAYAKSLRGNKNIDITITATATCQQLTSKYHHVGAFEYVRQLLTKAV